MGGRCFGALKVFLYGQLCSDYCRWKVVNERLQWDPMQTLSVSLDGADAAVHCTRGSSVPSTGEHKKQCTQCSFFAQQMVVLGAQAMVFISTTLDLLKQP